MTDAEKQERALGKLNNWPLCPECKQRYIPPEVGTKVCPRCLEQLVTALRAEVAILQRQLEQQRPTETLPPPWRQRPSPYEPWKY